MQSLCWSVAFNILLKPQFVSDKNVFHKLTLTPSCLSVVPAAFYPSLSFGVSTGGMKIHSSLDGRPPVSFPSPSLLLSVLPSPPLSSPLLQVSPSSPCITHCPPDRPGQGVSLRGQTWKQSSLCHSDAPQGPTPPGRELSAGPGLLGSC